MAVAAERLPGLDRTGPAPRWPRSRPAAVVRALLQHLLLLPIVRWLCRPLRVEGGLRRVRGPVVFAANHASHADTAVILRALPARIRRRTAPAAAEDYFFTGRVRGAAVSLLVGAFPFPRCGTAGLARAEDLLTIGQSVVLFPEGTRSTGGRVGRFKPGVGVLAARGAVVVPVGLAGTRDVLPKGRVLPRQAPVAVAFGEPMRFPADVPADAIAELIRRKVSRLEAAARLLRPRARRTGFDRARSLARSPAGLALVFCWGVAEALVAPVVPDFPVALLAVAAPGRVLILTLAAVAGSVIGGTAAYWAGAAGHGPWLAAHAPLVTERMRAHALADLGAHGAPALLGQPWSGIPFKAYGYQAAAAGVGFGAHLWFSVIGRAARIVLVGTVFATAAAPFHIVLRTWIRRLYGAFALAFSAAFAMGFARVVAGWS